MDEKDNIIKPDEKTPDLEHKPKKQLPKYVMVSLAVLITYVIGLFLFFVMFRYQGFAAFFGQIMVILQPILIGLALAYLLNPIMMRVERLCIKVLLPRIKNEKVVRRISRFIGTIMALAFLSLIIYLLLEMIVPQLIQSIQNMIATLPVEVNSFSIWLTAVLSGDNYILTLLRGYLTQAVDYLESYISTQIIPAANTYITSVTIGVINIIKVVFNVVIGLIVSVYVLMSKETFTGQSKKIIYTVFSKKQGNIIIRTFRRSHKIFGGFISGKIVDSMIIGVLCYIILYIMKMPYTLLVAVVIGATNVIPFFGPFIGAIPCVILIALADPIKGIYFIIMILILQQIDGNIIGPKILGDSTGLSSFWVIFAILIGGGMFGFVGMVLGVPVFAVIYSIISEVVTYILKKKKLPSGTSSYIQLDSIDERTSELKYPEKTEVPFSTEKDQ
ncbi:MAG: AI-2E family transporter [Lachnospiraceae bacterium]